MRYLYLLIAAIIFTGCTSSGPREALDKMASALENNNSVEFMRHMDIAAYATNKLKDYTQNDGTLSSLNSLGNMLGLGNIDKLIESMVDIKGQLTRQFERGVASGELVAQCRTDTTPECPWVPQSLREAQVVQIDGNAAIARVTTPTHLTSWLALHKDGENWQVVGQAVMENRAREIATAAGSGASKETPAAPGAPKKAKSGPTEI